MCKFCVFYEWFDLKHVCTKEQGKNTDLKNLKYGIICTCLVCLLKISNCDRPMVLMILWHEYEIVRVAKYIMWLQWKHDSVISDLYTSFPLLDRVHTQIFFWLVVYILCNMDISVRRCQIWKTHTYVKVLYKSFVHLLGFCSMSRQ